MLYDKMATGDVTFTQDGAGNVKLHPYLITLVRWCVSCLWSTASVFLHRLVTTPLPPITAPKLSSKPRQAGTDHLHPEPKVECVVLHTPESPTLDVIFVHGLYGSLGNTWRQGDWRAKYKLDPTKVPLRNHTCNPCKCQTTHEQPYNNIHFTYETNLNETELNDTLSFKQINGCLKKILPNENSFITEKFYNNTFLNVNVNYETQGKFVTELFKTDCNKNCDLNIECKLNGNVNKCKCKINGNCKRNECNCEINDEFKLDKCGVGCGCICDDCYSSCWPRDWIKEDFPGARVISINYTSDPYLWRPLWVKASKRLRLHERAEQMTEQLLDLGVGKRPIIWVGHSKGGLFIKQIYCEAYEAYMKINKNVNKNKINNNTKDQSNNSDNINNNYNSYEENEFNNRHDKNKEYCNDIPSNKNNENNDQQQFTKKDKNTEKILVKDKNIDKIDIFGDINEESEFDNLIDISIYNNEDIENLESNGRSELNMVSSYKEEDFQALETRSSLWLQSAGFMFYSVPHRGSPLAAIKTPITARSIELLEISKDCQLVQQLQSRWLLAASSSRPLVRSLVETCRTLMSVLWLRIVSVDSADAGLGSLHGVSVDHREICKPSSRNCLLYTELTDLIQKSLNKCNCRTNS